MTCDRLIGNRRAARRPTSRCTGASSAGAALRQQVVPETDPLDPPRRDPEDRRRSAGGRILAHGILVLDAVGLAPHRLGRHPADVRLRGQVAAIIVPGFTRQFAGEGAELLDGRRPAVLRIWRLRGLPAQAGYRSWRACRTIQLPDHRSIIAVASGRDGAPGAEPPAPSTHAATTFFARSRPAVLAAR